MQANGRFQVSAPVSTTVTGVAIMAASTTALVYQSGDTTITAAYAAGVTSVAVAERRGIVASGSMILGYGTANQETVTVDSGYTPATGAGSVTVSTTTKAHAKNERIVDKVASVPLRPGSVVVLDGASAAATDDGKGALSGSGVTGTVDYNTGTVALTFGTSTSRTLTYSADVIGDTAAIEDQGGNGFFKNYQNLKFTKRDQPDFMIVTNLGSNEVGLFVEKVINNGRSFKYVNGTSLKVPAFGRGVITITAGQDGLGVRVRAGAKSGGASSTVDIDGIDLINDNGQ